jgi:hypothetical protein
MESILKNAEKKKEKFKYVEEWKKRMNTEETVRIKERLEHHESKLTISQ